MGNIGEKQKNDLVRFGPFAIKLDEKELGNQQNEKIAEQVQVLRTGTFHHARMGEISITEPMLKTMINNFQNNVRGIDIAIDYKHESDDIAAGWIQELFLSEDEQELWARVKWTPRGEKKLSDREFRYISADFHLNYVDNETLTEFGPTLFGAGLTNRPVVKRMKPAIELAELVSKKVSTKQKGETKMDKDLEKQVKELTEKNAKLSEQIKTLQEGDSMAKEVEDMKKMVQDLRAQVEDLKGKLQAAEDEKQKLEEEKKMAEKEKQFETLLSEGKVVEAQRKAYLEDNMIEFAKNAGQVNLAESGSASPKNTDNTQDAQEKVLKLAEEKGKELGIPSFEAISTVLDENPKLCEQYEKETAV